MNRLRGKVINYINGRLRDYRRDYKEFMYDIGRVPKRQLKLIYSWVAFGTALSTSMAYMLINTYYLNKYKDWVRLYASSGKPLPLEENLELLALREWNQSHIGRKYKLMDLISFFPCVGSQAFSAGDIESRSGAIVGLPHNFTYNTVNDVKINELQICGQRVSDLDTDSDLVKQFIESLVLSENAKRFAITRELHITNHSRVMFKTVIITIWTLLGVGVGQQVILSFNIRRNYLLSFIIRLISMAIAFVLCYGMNEALEYNFNIDADELTVAQGDQYYEGAIEYYEKLLKRNAIIRKLFGEKVKNRFSEVGEVMALFEPSIQKRLDNIYKLKADQQSDEAKEES